MGKYNHSDKHHDKGQGVKKYKKDKSINEEWLGIHQPWNLPKNQNFSHSGWTDCGSVIQDADDFMDFQE